MEGALACVAVLPPPLESQQAPRSLERRQEMLANFASAQARAIKGCAPLSTIMASADRKLRSVEVQETIGGMGAPAVAPKRLADR